MLAASFINMPFLVKPLSDFPLVFLSLVSLLDLYLYRNLIHSPTPLRCPMSVVCFLTCSSLFLLVFLGTLPLLHFDSYSYVYAVLSVHREVDALCIASVSSSVFIGCKIYPASPVVKSNPTVHGDKYRNIEI